MIRVEYFDGTTIKTEGPTNANTSVSITGKCYDPIYNVSGMVIFLKYTKGDESGVDIVTSGRLSHSITDWFTLDSSNFAADTLTFYNVDVSCFDYFKIDIALGDAGATSGSDVIGTGDGVKTSFSNTLSNYPIPGSVTISYTIGGTNYTATDDGNGSISGTNCTGTIDYDSKLVQLTFASPPDDTTNITATYAIAGILTVLVKPK